MSVTVYSVLAQVGLPAKSGVSGIIIMVVPNVVGFACWSPNLDSVGKKKKNPWRWGGSSLHYALYAAFWGRGSVFESPAMILMHCRILVY